MKAPPLPFHFDANSARALTVGAALDHVSGLWKSRFAEGIGPDLSSGERDEVRWLADRPAGSAKQHGRRRQAWLFLRWIDRNACPEGASCGVSLRAFLRRCVAERWHTTLADQLLERLLFLEGNVTRPIFGVLLTGRSFADLGIEPPVDAVFAGGMSATRTQLGDVTMADLGSDRDPWVGHGFEEDFDLVLTVAGDTQTDVDAWVMKLANAAGEHGFTCAHVERGFHWKPDGKEGGLREPFGFRDDISNLLFLDEDVKKYAERVRHPAASEVGTWSQVFHLPSGDVPAPGTVEGGSFVVFRKLEQNVREFAALGKATMELVGREPDGAPLLETGNGGMNDFNYASDMAATPRCPFHAHVRKSNPRGSSDEPLPVERRTLFPRRGMVFAPDHNLPDGPYDATRMPNRGVGLLFVGYMGQIDAQFVRMQTSWLNNPLFPSANPAAGPDQVVGSRSRFVVPRGGAYLYAPPWGWLCSVVGSV